MVSLVDPPPLDLDDAETELYGLTPEEFIPRRKELVTQARAAKNRPLATAIGQLRRPTRSAWLLNLLARAEPEQVEALLEVGTALAEAQRRRSGDDLRRLSKDRRTAVDAATRRAVAVGVEHGHTATEATTTEVTQTLTAALADAEVGEALRAGRLAAAASYGGFGPDALGDALAAMSATATATPTKTDADEAEEQADEPPSEPSAADQEAAAARAAAIAAARETAEQARTEAEEAESAADQATAAADELADRVEQLTAELAEAKTAADQAQKDARSSRKRAQELRNAAEDAATALAKTESGP